MRWMVLTLIVVFLAVGNHVCLGVELLSNNGFETDEPLLGEGIPSVCGVWGGDVAAIVEAENGITPRNGSRMLHFIYASETGPSSSDACEVFQLIDMSPWAADIAAGNVVANLSFYANRISGDSQTDTRFTCWLMPREGNPADYKTSPTLGSDIYGSIESDSVPGTWEKVETSVLLPTNTDYLAVSINAFEDVCKDDYPDPEFDGHYADDASLTLTVVPEPSTLALLTAALLVSLIACPMRRRSAR